MRDQLAEAELVLEKEDDEKECVKKVEQRKKRPFKENCFCLCAFKKNKITSKKVK